MGEHGGNIVNIVLISSMGMAGQSHSAAAREAVKNLSITLGTEWAPKTRLNLSFSIINDMTVGL